MPNVLGVKQVVEKAREPFSHGPWAFPNPVESSRHPTYKL